MRVLHREVIEEVEEVRSDDVENNTEKQKKKKTLSLKKIIIIISSVALSAVLTTSLSLGLYYGLNQKEETNGDLYLIYNKWILNKVFFFRNYHGNHYRYSRNISFKQLGKPSKLKKKKVWNSTLFFLIFDGFP